jgi:hypothetical protein
MEMLEGWWKFVHFRAQNPEPFDNNSCNFSVTDVKQSNDPSIFAIAVEAS